ncbi:hypothetical protein C8R43DRAFT_1201123 [Mycena crocata]|nr:hypothetical protein C8R43DRAFT_1201123 [Mycena crocata]
MSPNDITPIDKPFAASSPPPQPLVISVWATDIPRREASIPVAQRSVPKFVTPPHAVKTPNPTKLKVEILPASSERREETGNSHKHSNERSSSPMEMIMSDFEDGQISTTDAQDERFLGQPKLQNMDSEPAVELPLTSEHLQQLALTREMLAKHSTSPWFEEIVVGCWVRYFIGHHESKPVYRICEITGLVPAAKPYNLNPDKITHQSFELKHGKAERAWQMDHTSNEKWTSDEFKRLQDTCKDEKVLLPSRKEVDERFSEMQVLIFKPITEADINVMMARKRQLAAQGTSGGSLSVVERSRLIAQRTLAQRRQDYNEMREIDERLVKMGESGPPASEEDVPRDRLTLVSERNRKANMEAVRCAELAEVERKRRERKSRDNNIPMVNDPSARRRTIPRLCESATPTSRPERLNPAMSGTAKKLAPAPATKWNGNAIGKTFEEVIESIEVDLGDF